VRIPYPSPAGGCFSPSAQPEPWLADPGCMLPRRLIKSRPQGPPAQRARSRRGLRPKYLSTYPACALGLWRQRSAWRLRNRYQALTAGNAFGARRIWGTPAPPGAVPSPSTRSPLGRGCTGRLARPWDGAADGCHNSIHGNRGRRAVVGVTKAVLHNLALEWSTLVLSWISFEQWIWRMARPAVVTIPGLAPERPVPT
jgi:hypothetical protein